MIYCVINHILFHRGIAGLGLRNEEDLKTFRTEEVYELRFPKQTNKQKEVYAPLVTDGMSSEHVIKSKNKNFIKACDTHTLECAHGPLSLREK